jgi:putative lipoic acid-binding regulatory protein
MMDHRPSIELLESTHLFPGTYQIKAIGASADDFAGRVISAVQEELPAPSDLDYRIRTTQAGRHVAVTLDITVQTAAQVRTIYARIQEVSGLTLLF